VMPTLVGLFAIGRSWTQMGPFTLGIRLYKVLAVASLVAVGLIVWIGVQPPNEKALTVAIVAPIVLAAGWWLGVRRFFRGPPTI
jgi:hypothetical protein